MLKTLTILTLTTFCIFGAVLSASAQDGNPQVFEKKTNQQQVGNEDEPEQEPDTVAGQEQDEPGSLTPVKEGKASQSVKSGIRKLPAKADSTQNTQKEKEPKSKYNILLYYFYKSKHEETESKENSSADN